MTASDLRYLLAATAAVVSILSYDAKERTQRVLLPIASVLVMLSGAVSLLNP